MKLLEVADLYKNYLSANLNREVHADDRMYSTGKEHYYVVGESGVDCVMSALALTRLTKVKRILDMGCGYGRVARHLKAAFPEAEIVYSDLDSAGADFCAKTFDGTAHYSEPELTRANLPDGFDVIWVGSLFTHINRSRALNWLTYLAERLGSHGVLLASFHGYFTAVNPPFAIDGIDLLRRQFDATGYGFCEYTKSHGIPEGEYGVSLSKPSCIVDMANSIPGTRVISYTERGWAYNHDVLTLCKDDRAKPWGAS